MDLRGLYLESFTKLQSKLFQLTSEEPLNEHTFKVILELLSEKKNGIPSREKRLG